MAHDDEHDADLDPRRVLMTPIGPRWHDLDVPSSQRPPLAEKLNETLLLDFRPCAEDELTDLDPLIPLRLSLMTARWHDQVLLVRNARTGEWELSGGDIRNDETPRQTAERRFREETGLTVGAVAFVGIATVQIGHARDIELVALFRTTLDDSVGPELDHRERELVWWTPGTELAGLSPIDAHLAEVSVRER